MTNSVHHETLEIKMKMASIYQRLRDRFNEVLYNTLTKAIEGKMAEGEVIQFDGLTDHLHIRFMTLTDGSPVLLVFSTGERGNCTSMQWTQGDTQPTQFCVETPGCPEPLNLNNINTNTHEHRLMTSAMVTNHYFPQLDLLHYYSPAEHTELASGLWTGISND